MSLQYPQKLDLDKLDVYEELDLTTQDLFNIDNLPNILTLGKHYFTISFNESETSNLSLKLSSQVLFEFKDSQGNLVFSDITNYQSVNGSAVCYVFIREQRSEKLFDEIANGIGTFTIVGELDNVPEQFIGTYNVRLTIPIEIRKDLPNLSPILFQSASLVQSMSIFSESIDIDTGDSNYKRSYINISASHLETFGGRIDKIELSYRELKTKNNEFEVIQTYPLSSSIYESNLTETGGLNPISDSQKFPMPRDLRRNTDVTFKLKFINANGDYAQDISKNNVDIEITSSNSLPFIGSPIILEESDNLISSGALISAGYKGFTSASAGSGSGFILYSGSNVLSSVTNDYQDGGVGLELVNDSSSFFKFRSNPGILDVRTNSFFLGSNTQFISGAAGNVEISSSNFHLTNQGNITMSGEINASAGTIGGFTIGSDRLTAGTDDNFIGLIPGTGIQVGDSTFNDAEFSVTNEGIVTAKNLIIDTDVDNEIGITLRNPNQGHKVGIFIDDSGSIAFISASKRVFESKTDDTSKTALTGKGSTFVGLDAKADGDKSFSGGNKATSSGEFSLALGAFSNAVGTGSIAIGSGSEAFKIGDVAIGARAQASGSNSNLGEHVVIGKDAISLGGQRNTIIGGRASASLNSKQSVAIGTAAKILGGSDSNGAIAIGVNSEAQRTAAVSIGNAAQSLAVNAFALGASADALGYGDIAIGNTSLASGGATSTTAFGLGNIAIGPNTKAYFQETIAIGAEAEAGISAGNHHRYALAIGRKAKAQGFAATAIGSGSYSFGTASFGFGSTISVSGERSVGFNVGQTPAILAQDNTFVIMGGNTGIGTITPTKTLQIEGDISASGTGSFGIINVGGGEFSSASLAAGGGGGGSFNNFTVTADGGSNQTIADGNTLDIAGGDGITTAVGATDTVTINVDASQDGHISSILTTDLKLGEDAQTKIDFETINEIHFDVNNAELLNLAGSKISGSLISTASFGSIVLSDKVQGDLNVSGKSNFTGHITASGNISASGTSHKFGGDLHVSSTGDAVLTLESDTDNSGEDDNPYVKYMQDGGAMVALVGMTGNVNKSPESETTLTAFGGGDSPANSLAMITTGNAAAQAGHLFLGTNKTGSIFIHSDSQKVQIGRTVNNNVTSSAMLTVEGDISASGNLNLGTAGVTSERGLTISSTKDTFIKLDADIGNSGEDDNPYLLLVQDGGAVSASIGLVGTADRDPQNSTYNDTRINSLFIGTYFAAAGDANDSAIMFGTSGSDGKKVRMTIDSGQDGAYVGIGNNYPQNAAHLTVEGNISASGKVITTEVESPTDFTLDVEGDITLDANGADIILSDDGTDFGRFKRDSSDFIIKSETNNKDIVFRGQDGGATITALTLDMSEAGKAIFTGNISGSLTSTLSMGGQATLGGINSTTHITASGDISSSGTITAEQLTTTDDLTVGDDIKMESSTAAILFQNGTGATVGSVSYTENSIKLTNSSGNPNTIGHLVVSASGGTATENVRVGIGTETPDKMLTVAGDISASGDIFGNSLIIGPGLGDFSQNVVISGSDGNLLIQGNNDGGDVALTIRNSAAGGSTDETTSIIFGTNDSSAKTPALIRAGREQVYTGVTTLEDGFLAFHTDLNGTIAEKVRITSDGNMGIGISTPTKPLQVQGDISGSGVIQTPNFNSNEIRDIKFTGFFMSTTSKVFVPLHGTQNEAVNYSSQENRGLGFVAPYDGYLDKVVVRVSDNAPGSSVVGLHKSADGTEYPNSTATYTTTVNISSDETSFNFAFGTSKTFSAGEIIAMSFDPTSSPSGNVNMTMVFVYDITTGV
mgnify:CR=1 FL=1